MNQFDKLFKADNGKSVGEILNCVFAGSIQISEKMTIKTFGKKMFRKTSHTYLAFNKPVLVYSVPV